MSNNNNSGLFSDILKKLADRIDSHFVESAAPKREFLNRIDLSGFREIQRLYKEDRSLCKKSLNVEGIWRLDLHYGPQFETQLRTERAGAITIQMDDITLLGGGGTALHPVSICMAGFNGCVAAAFAKWAAMRGIELKNFRIRSLAAFIPSFPSAINSNSI